MSDSSSEAKIQDFLANAQPYQLATVEHLLNASALLEGELAELLQVGRVNRYCATCKRDQPFVEMYDIDDDDVGFHKESVDHEQGDISVYSLYYKCANCHSELRYWIEFVDSETGFVTGLRKVGEMPSPLPRLNNRLASALGSEQDLYRRAQICLARSFGIGACSYLRRCLENHANALLDLLADDVDPNSERWSELQALKNRGDGKSKLQAIDRLLPNELRVDGDNPLTLMYERLSAGLHSYDEDKATAVAHTSMSAAATILTGLSKVREARQDQKQFSQEIRRLRQDFSE